MEPTIPKLIIVSPEWRLYLCTLIFTQVHKNIKTKIFYLLHQRLIAYGIANTSILGAQTLGEREKPEKPVTYLVLFFLRGQADTRNNTHTPKTYIQTYRFAH